MLGDIVQRLPQAPDLSAMAYRRCPKRRWRVKASRRRERNSHRAWICPRVDNTRVRTNVPT